MCEQACVVVVNDAVLLTLHSGQTIQLGAHAGKRGGNVFSSAGSAFQRMSDRSSPWKLGGSGDQLQSEHHGGQQTRQESVLGILFEALRAKLRVFRAESGQMHTASVRTLAVEIAWALQQYNFTVRDQLVGQ